MIKEGLIPANKLIEKLLKEKEIINNIPEECDEDGFGDGESLYSDGVTDGKFQGICKALEIIQEVINESTQTMGTAFKNIKSE